MPRVLPRFVAANCMMTPERVTRPAFLSTPNTSLMILAFSDASSVPAISDSMHRASVPAM